MTLGPDTFQGGHIVQQKYTDIKPFYSGPPNSIDDHFQMARCELKRWKMESNKTTINKVVTIAMLW